ncbi:MAG: hypothetical protein ACLRZH_13730 [Ruthenibacterium lactatiformans]
MRAVLAQSSTNLTATQIFDYERIFGFLRKEPPNTARAYCPAHGRTGAMSLRKIPSLSRRPTSSAPPRTVRGAATAYPPPRTVCLRARLETQTDSPSLRLRQAAGQAPAARAARPGRRAGVPPDGGAGPEDDAA